MSSVREILAQKGTSIFTVNASATVLEAAELMNDRKVGALVVIDDRRVVGIFTERDILTRVVARRRDPAHTPVSEVTTRDVYCCTIETSLDEASTAMKERRIRHLPVLDDTGELTGLVSIGDLNAFHASVQERAIHELNEYIYGRF